MKRPRNRRTRTRSGIAIAALMLFMAAFVILPVGLFMFDMFRFIIAQQQLRAACDAASLAGAAALAAVDPTTGDISGAQTQAMTSALKIFQKNSVLGISLASATVRYNSAPSNSANPNPNQAVVNIQLQNSSGQAVALGQPAGSMVFSVYFGEVPSFGQLLGVKKAIAFAQSSGGLVPFDIALCVDISGSIDDQTPVTFVKRYWSGNTVGYSIPAGGQGILFDILKPSPTGTRVNAMPPQNLSSASYAYDPQGTTLGNQHPLFFSESPISDFPNNSMRGLRANLAVGAVSAGSEQGCPPGNFDANVPRSRLGNGINPDADLTAFTDLVVNLDGNPVFAGWTSPDGFSFPNIQTLVEAARGNLDLPTPQFLTSQGNSDANLQGHILPQPRPGYKAAYYKRVLQLLNPMNQAQQAEANFVQRMSVNADAQFSFIAFTGGEGTSDQSTWSPSDPYNSTANNVDANWAAGGQGTFPLPLIHLAQSGSAGNNTTSCMQAIESLHAAGMTDICGAIEAATTELTSPQHRPLARRAIILFTDGEPDTPPGPFGGGPASTGARRAYDDAKGCARLGIPIYTIGLAQNPQIRPEENKCLGDSNTLPAPPQGMGIARLSGGMYVPLDDVGQLDQAFQKIERSLVTLR